MAEERKTVLEAVAKLGLAEKKFAAKIKDFEEVANVSMNAHFGQRRAKKWSLGCEIFLPGQPPGCCFAKQVHFKAHLC